MAAQVADRFHAEDRLMLWFDFFNHDNDRVVASMAGFVREVLPRLERLGVPVPSAPRRAGRRSSG